MAVVQCTSGLSRRRSRAQSRRSIVASTSQTGTHSAITRPFRAVQSRSEHEPRRSEPYTHHVLREIRRSSLSAAFPACGLAGHPQRARSDGRSFFEQTLGARRVSAMNFESRCPTVGALAHDPRHRAIIGNDKIGHVTEADDTGIYEAPNSGDRCPSPVQRSPRTPRTKLARSLLCWPPATPLAGL